MAANEANPEKKRLAQYAVPDLTSLTIHLLNTLPEEAEQSETERALHKMHDFLKDLVGGLQTHFAEIDSAFDGALAATDTGKGAGHGNNPYALQAGGGGAGANVTKKVQEQEEALHTMTVQYMNLTGRVDKAEAKIAELDKIVAETAESAKRLEHDVKQLKMEFPIISERIQYVNQQQEDFSKTVMPKFAPLENDVSAINGVLQLDSQHFVSKVGALNSGGLTSPLFVMYDQRLDNLEEEGMALKRKTAGVETIPSARSNKKTRFGEDEEDQEEDAIRLGWSMGFEGSDLGKCLYFFHSCLNQMSTMEEMIKQWEVFHQSIETRIDEVVVRHVDDKLNAMLQDPKQKDYAVRLIHSLSPNAEYQNLLTRLDMKVDKTHFQKFTTKLYEQVNGLSRMSSLQGTVLDEVRRNVTDDEAEKWGGGGSGWVGVTAGNFGHITTTDLTKLRLQRSIMTSTTSSETFKQAHMRLPKSSLSGTTSRGRGGGSSRLTLATTPRVRPNSARV